MWLLTGKPKQAQVEALRRVSHKPEGYGFFMEMGLGKTAVVIAEFVKLLSEGDVDKLIIFCPYTLTGVWEEEIRNWTDGKLVVQQWPFKAADPKAHVYILYYETLSVGGAKGVDFLEVMLDKYECYVTLDESTMIKGYSSQRAKELLRLRPRMKYKRALSGWPMVQGPQDLFTQLKFIGGLDGVNFFQFRARYCKMGGYMGKQIVGPNPHTAEELSKLVQQKAFRAMKKDWTDLPEKIHLPPRQVKMNPEQQKMYRDMVADFLAELDGDNFIEAHMVITQMVKLQQIASNFIIDEKGVAHGIKGTNYKLEEIRRMLDEEIPGKIIVPVYFQYSARLLQKELADYGVCAILGGQDREEIEREKWRFNNQDDNRILIAQISASKWGHTLLGTPSLPCSTTVFYENSFSLDDRIQIEDRSHRYGQRHDVNLVDLVTSKIELRVIKALQQKRDVSSAIVDAIRTTR